MVPNSALAPGLVYNAGFDDYVAFLCGTGQLAGLLRTSPSIRATSTSPTSPSAIWPAFRPSPAPSPTSGATATFRATTAAPQGFKVTVSPRELTIPAGESRTFTVKIERTRAPLGEYRFGSLTWTGGGKTVRSVIVVSAVQLAAPEEVLGSETSGSASWDIIFGYTGAFSALPHGLVAPLETPGYVVDDPANDINVALATGVGITVHDIDVPAGTGLARFSLFDEFVDGADDLDLYVFDPSGDFVGGSGSGTSEEEVNVFNPVAGTYSVVVHGWGTDEVTGGPGTNYTLFSWNVSATASDGSQPTDLSVVAPGSAVLGTTGTVTASWANLSEGVKYLGGVSYHDGVGQIDYTIVSVNTD